MAKQAPLDIFLAEVARIVATGAGTAETSYYPALAAVLNAVGQELKPAVFCLSQVSGKHAGLPDFGFFEQKQFHRGEAREWKAGVLPERGVMEAKGASYDIGKLVTDKTVQTKYLPAYGLVLVSNLWQFRLLEASGTRESFDLAADEVGFWTLVHGPRPNSLRIRFADFLQRCLMARAPLAKPADVAFFLASYARDALARLEERADLPALASLRSGMEAALGMQFDNKDGEHLFRSTLVQTLFYGLFSAWIVEARAGHMKFDWRSAQWSLNVPVAQFLFGQVATPQALQPLGLIPLLDAAAATLERVSHQAFFSAFDEARAVQYFYEPFLEFFDPDLRRRMGVWYTPPEIVTYMVERVDRVLRSELGIADGLADEDVWVLDPCCGTGSFVVAVLDRIERTLAGKGLGALAAERLKKAATTRVVGFEIMTAPLVIAHWQVGEALRRAGSPLADGERASVFLTNALTGWHDEGQEAITGFDVLLRERTEAAAVKRKKPILVVLGNPPYNAFDGTSPASEGGLVDAYKASLQSEWGVKKFNLDDLYVRFFRIAERRIAEITGRGVISYISNFSWLAGTSYVVMRQRLLAEFDAMWIDCLNGDSRETGKLTPDGKPDPSIFSTPLNREGIRVGTAIATMVRRPGEKKRSALVKFRQFWGTNKRSELAATWHLPKIDADFAALAPTPANKFSLRPGTASATYSSWPELPALARISPLNGLMEKRGGALIDADREPLKSRMQSYLDPKKTLAEVQAVVPGLAGDHARFVAQKARSEVILREGFQETNLKRYWLRPFEVCWAYVTAVRPVWNEPRPQLLHVLPNADGFLVSRPKAISDPEHHPTCWTLALGDNDAMRGHAYYLPVTENLSGSPRPNLSPACTLWLSNLGIPADVASSRLVWHHVLAVTYAPAWLTDNVEGIRQGWPRVPLPDSVDLLRASAALGARVAALLDPDAPVLGVTGGDIPAALATIAVPTSSDGGAPDWRLTAGWGHRTGKSVTMPGKGRTDERDYSAADAPLSTHSSLLGARTRDVWLNANTYWKNIPEAVWDFHIGGYQVIKKWLSYREQSIIGRALSAEEVAHVMNTARRLAALRLMGPELDVSYHACAEAHVPLPVIAVSA